MPLPCRLHGLLFAAACAVAALCVAAGPVAAADEPFSTLADVPGWIERVRLGGYVQADLLQFDQSDASRAVLDDVQNVANFRRARVVLSGPLADRIDYRFGLDFGGPGRPSFLDTRIDIGLIGTTAADPVEPLALREADGSTDRFLLGRVGRFKQPQGLSALDSSADLLFLERAATATFAPFRQTGAALFAAPEGRRITAAASLYRYSADVFGAVAGDDGFGQAARLTAIAAQGEAGLLHLGASVSRQTEENNVVRFRSTPGVGFNELDFDADTSTPVPFFLDTGPLDADGFSVVGLEAAGQLAPLGLFVRGEWFLTQLDGFDDAGNGNGGGSTPTFAGWSVEAAYCLTGEVRPYDTAFGVFGGLTPDADFLDGGPGAIELVARVDALDLSDGSVDGGSLANYSLGANWVWNPNVKLQGNWVLNRLTRDAADDAPTHIVALRMQFSY